MNNFNFYNRFNLWSPIQPASFTDSLSYLQHIEILREKINEVVENLNNANFYARGLKPGKAIDIVGATKGSGFFNGEDPTIINTVINNSVLTDNKPGWHRIFTTKVITEDLKSGLTFLFQEQPLNHNCENDKLSWGILKINFVYNPTDADVDYNTYNIKIVDFAFEEERNLTDKLDRFMLVRRINPCNAENVMELYYKVPTKEEATECADACGPAGLFTLLGIDNNTINFNTFIKLENDGLNTTTYDGINGVKTNPVINFDYDDITLIGDTEGYGLMNTRNVKVDPTTTPQLIDSFDTTGDVDMIKVNVLKNHRPYDETPKTNDIVFNMEVPKLIDKISVENTGVVEGNGSVVVPEVLGAENNIAITIENTFNEDAIKDKVEQYAPKTDVIPPDGSMVLYLAPVDGDDTMDGLTVDTAMKTMTALLNKGYAKEIEVHLVGEPPVAEGEGTIIVNGANYSSIKIVDENNILAGYSLEVNNSNVIITNASPAAGAGSLDLRNDEIEDIEEILLEEDTVIDYDPNTQRVHINTYIIDNNYSVYSLSNDETVENEDNKDIMTESYYSIMPLQLTQNSIYSLEVNNSTIDIQGTFTDVFNCKLENTSFNNTVENLNITTFDSNNSNFNSVNCTLNTVEIYNNNMSITPILTINKGNIKYSKLLVSSQIKTFNADYLNLYNCNGELNLTTYSKNISFTGCNFKISGGQINSGLESNGSIFITCDSRYNFPTDTNFLLDSFKTFKYSKINDIFYLSKYQPYTQLPYISNSSNKKVPGNVYPDGTTITMDAAGVISAVGGGSGGGDTVEPGYGITISNNDETGKKRISVDYGNGLTLGDSYTDSSGVIHFPLIPSIDNKTITLNQYNQLTASGGSGGSINEGDGITITEDSATGAKTIGIDLSYTNQNGGPGLYVEESSNKLMLKPANNGVFGGVQLDTENTPIRAGDYGVLSLAVSGGLMNQKQNNSTILRVYNDSERGLGLDSNDVGPLFVKADNKTITFDSNGQLQYIMPPATNQTLGGIKVGNGLTIDETGLLSANGGGGNVSLIPNNTETITYYVDTTNGSDSNSGLSSDAPLKTLEKALNKHDSINIVINIKSNAEYYFIDGFGYRTITVNFYGADYSTVGGYGTEVYVKDAPITFNVLPQILRGLNSNIYVNSLDGGSAYYNELNLENSILVMPNVSFIQNDNYLRFKQLYMKESYLKIVNQSTDTVNEVSVLLCDIIDSIIEGFKTKLKFLTNYNYTQSIVNSTIKGSYIDVNYGASGISDPNNVKVIFTNGCDFIVIPDITSGYGMKLDNTVLNNCSITTNGWNQDGVDINIVSSYFTNCNLDVFIKDNKLINSKFKNCNISFSYLNGVHASAWTMNTTIENSTCYVGSINNSNVISGLTLTHCNWIGTELNDNQWTVAGSIVNGVLKT